MKIKKILSQSRRDFTAIYKCEHCGHEEEGGGYDDANYHRNVVPARKCGSCEKTADKENYRPMGTKYPENQVV